MLTYFFLYTIIIEDKNKLLLISIVFIKSVNPVMYDW